jgi:hypothetical protein
MPTIIPGYVYSLLAALIVGSMVVYCCSIVSFNIKNEANDQQLTNVLRYVAAECLTLVSHTTENQNLTYNLDIPSHIGDQRFWVRLVNDSSNTWIESGYGAVVLSSDTHIAIPAKAVVTGSFVSGSGRPILQCHFQNGIATLTLTTE